MSIIDPEAIKKIVKNNFDRSSEQYQVFEEKFGLFRYLTIELAEACNIQLGMTVCDIGCGTGTSSIILAKVLGKNGKVVGIDFSENMLRQAEFIANKYREDAIRSSTDNDPQDMAELTFVRCDADRLSETFSQNHQKFDSVLYNACIFLIPEPKNTMADAFELLRPGGCIGFNYLVGIYEHPSNDVSENEKFESDLFFNTKTDGKPFAPYGRRINDIESYPNILKEIGFKKVQCGMISKRLAQDELLAFFDPCEHF